MGIVQRRFKNNLTDSFNFPPEWISERWGRDPFLRCWKSGTRVEGLKKVFIYPQNLQCHLPVLVSGFPDKYTPVADT